MPDAMKTLATGIIWLVAGAIAIVGLISSDGNIGGAVPIVLIPMSVALFSTAAVWTSSKNENEDEKVSIEKSKRTGRNRDSRAALLMEMMTEDEREAFKDALRHRILEDAARGDFSDGELPTSLGELLDETSSNKRLR